MLAQQHQRALGAWCWWFFSSTYMFFTNMHPPWECWWKTIALKAYQPVKPGKMNISLCAIVYAWPALFTLCMTAFWLFMRMKLSTLDRFNQNELTVRSEILYEKYIKPSSNLIENIFIRLITLQRDHLLTPISVYPFATSRYNNLFVELFSFMIM